MPNVWGGGGGGGAFGLSGICLSDGCSVTKFLKFSSILQLPPGVALRNKDQFPKIFIHLTTPISSLSKLIHCSTSAKEGQLTSPKLIQIPFHQVSQFHWRSWATFLEFILTKFIQCPISQRELEQFFWIHLFSISSANFHYVSCFYWGSF